MKRNRLMIVSAAVLMAFSLSALGGDMCCLAAETENQEEGYSV